jgi:hypothetical protein
MELWSACDWPLEECIDQGQSRVVAGQGRLNSLVENMLKKEPWSFFHCGFFDHRDLQSLNEYIFVFFVYQLKF